jgi:hypothetical protein
MFLRNVGFYLPVSSRGIASEKTNSDIFTAVRTSNLIWSTSYSLVSLYNMASLSVSQLV